jgi:hypothetical protein
MYFLHNDSPFGQDAESRDEVTGPIHPGELLSTVLLHPCFRHWLSGTGVGALGGEPDAYDRKNEAQRQRALAALGRYDVPGMLEAYNHPDSYGPAGDGRNGWFNLYTAEI